MTHAVARILTLVITFVIGAVYGTAATIAHSYAVGWFPLGLILATIGCAALLVALRTLTSDRWNTLGGGIGMLTAAYIFSLTSSGGSTIIAPQSAETVWVPIAWSFIVPVLVALVIAWPDLSRLRAAAPSADRSHVD